MAVSHIQQMQVYLQLFKDALYLPVQQLSVRRCLAAKRARRRWVYLQACIASSATLSHTFTHAKSRDEHFTNNGYRLG